MTSREKLEYKVGVTGIDCHLHQSINTMSAAPPSYDAVTSHAPNGQGQRDSNHLQAGGHNLERTSSATSDAGGDPFEGLSPDEQREFADEYRDLPEGWVKCWDPKSVILSP
jgi:hypothetical protein